jgi:probable H4MPT-linked C1 transfer pathway protein
VQRLAQETAEMTVIGLDIGGANLKAAAAAGTARSRPFALWKRPGNLAAELRQLLLGWPPVTRFAITMTGELCDCFVDRSDGVRHILSAVVEVAGRAPVHVWRTDGRFASLEESLTDPLPAASANWLALATFACRFVNNSPALVLDVGSTTTDIVPVIDGRPAPLGRDDASRLDSRELIYTGVRRTPICALLDLGEGMAEFFATTLDVYLILGMLAENERDCDTADGRPATREFASARLARMLGSDGPPPETIQRFAERIAMRQRDLIAKALMKVATALPQPPQRIVTAGSGSFLAQAAIDEFGRASFSNPEVIDLRKNLGQESSTAACARAVATLLTETEPLFN